MFLSSLQYFFPLQYIQLHLFSFLNFLCTDILDVFARASYRLTPCIRYGDEENSWEPAGNLAGATRLLTMYNINCEDEEDEEKEEEEEEEEEEGKRKFEVMIPSPKKNKQTPLTAKKRATQPPQRRSRLDEPCAASSASAFLICLSPLQAYTLK